MRGFLPFFFLFLFALPLAAQSNAPVVINEFCYDDSSTDDYEYVELYNATNQDIDIGGWVLDASDPNGPNLRFTIPKGTKIRAGSFWVLGSPLVPNADQVVSPATNIWQNSNEDLALLDGNGKIIDAVTYEANKGYWAAARFEKEGIWGNFTGIQRGDMYTAVMLGRNEVPPVATKAYGRAVVVLDPGTNKVTIRAEVRGFTPTAAHLFMGKKGTNGSSILTLKGGPFTWTGSGTLTASQVTALKAGGTYLNFLSGAHSAGEIRGQALPLPTTSWSRRFDGLDTGDNGLDFALLPSTPGMTNNVLGPMAPIYKENYDGKTAETPLPEWGSSYADPYVVDPTKVSAHNPNPIPVSPQGGKAAVFWDNSGGGNANMLLIDGGSPRVVVEGYVYFDANPESTGEIETWSLGVGGTTGTFFNIPDPGGTFGFTANANTGVSWTYQVTDKGAVLYLVDHNDGGWGTGAKSKPVVLGSLAIKKGVNDGWRLLRLELNGNHVVGSFDSKRRGCAGGTSFSALLPYTPSGWGIYVGYREALSNNATARPFTVDDLEIRFPSGSIRSFGRAVKTTKGTPYLDANGPGAIGYWGWKIILSGLVPSGGGFLVLGMGKLTPPLDLSLLGGQSGSYLYLLPSMGLGVSAGAQGTASLPMGIPCTPSLAGGVLFFQYFDFDPALPGALKLGNSRALEVKLGN